MSVTSARGVAGFVAAFVVALMGFALIGAAPASAAASGFTWITTPDGISPAGLKVYVVRGTHATKVTSATQYAVTQLRKYRIPFIWAGFTTRTSPGVGTIVVHQGGQCSGAIAVGGPSTLTTPIRNLVKVVAGEVSICKNDAFTHGTVVLNEILLHELGHVAGLDHYSLTVHGRLQIMYPIMQGQYQTYQDGDIAGLQAIAANTATLTRIHA